MEEYIEIVIRSMEVENTDQIIAHLSVLPFDSFWEEENLKAYILKKNWTSEVQAELDNILTPLSLSYDADDMPQVNWNEQWEQNFDPVEIADFCRIRATFHPEKSGFKHEIVINPKMAFGTGHHATTYMMIESMSELELKGLTLLDYGSGTGILTILAAKMGALVEGVEIEAIANENADENALLNGESDITFYTGDLQKASRKSYDIILANINRNVLLESMATLRSKVNEDGWLLLSGVLAEDEDVMIEAVHTAGFQIDRIRYKGEWTCFICYPKS